MQERDLRAADAGARRLVDQPQARLAQRVQRRRDVVDAVGDVVQARARAWRGSGPTGVSSESGASSSTWLSPTSSSAASTPCSAIVSRCTSGMPYVSRWSGDRGVEVGDRYADVVDAAEHGGECILSAVRIALAANRASGGGLDPEPLVAAMRGHGAEVELFDCDDDGLERIAAWDPSGSPSRAATGRSARSPSWPAGSACRWRSSPAGHRQRLRARARSPGRPGRGGRAGRHRHAHARRSSSAGSPTGARS